MFHLWTMLPITACRENGACFIGVGRFEPGQALEELEQLRATIAYPAFATITAAMVSHPDFSKRDLSAIRVVLNLPLIHTSDPTTPLQYSSAAF